MKFIIRKPDGSIHNTIRADLDFVQATLPEGYTYEEIADYQRSPEEIAARFEKMKDALIARFDQPSSIDKVMLKIAFLQENRIRALEGKQPITAQQFKDWVRSQID